MEDQMELDISSIHGLSRSQQLLCMYLSNNRLVNNLIRLNNDHMYNANINDILQYNNEIRQIFCELVTPSTSSSRRNNNHVPLNANMTTQNTGINPFRFYDENVVISPIITAETRTYDRFNSSDFDLARLFVNLFEPIELRLTPSQIGDATRVIRYGDIVSPLNDSCPISLNRFQENDNVTMIRHCNHIFHTNELNIWFTNHSKCPVCRYDIRNYVSST